MSKTCKQVGKQIQEIVKYCNEEYQCTGQNTGHIMSDKYGNQRPRQNLLVHIHRYARFWFFKKGMGIASPPNFVYDLSRKIFSEVIFF